MIRFVLDPAGAVVPDLKRKLPGRGVWVTADRAAVATAGARHSLARGFKRSVKAPASLVADTEALLERSLLDALGIARKAGLVDAGFTKTEAALSGKRVVALLQAVEAAPDGVRKLRAAAIRHCGEEKAADLPVLVLAGAQLDLALGRPNVIHAALLAGPASETVLARYRRLDRFRGGGLVKLAAECG
jgi:predicted RNA-binding protein YlxR (DUF448 family)